jgi:biopolymer transport protein ExbD
MRLESPPPIRKPLPLTPLVDVVFLLLMFFMLSSTFTKFGHIGLLLAQPASSSPPGSSAAPGVIVRVGAGLAVSINGRAVEFDRLIAVLDDFSGLGVESAVVQTSTSASVQDLAAVLEEARKSKLKRVVLVK